MTRGPSGNVKQMPRWRELIRLIAIALVLLTGFQVLACDLVSPACCKFSNTASQAHSDDVDAGDDTCLCCCTHYLEAHRCELAASNSVGGLTVFAPAQSQLPDPSRILQPPRV